MRVEPREEVPILRTLPDWGGCLDIVFVGKYMSIYSEGCLCSCVLNTVVACLSKFVLTVGVLL
jgi:hypothetical protein